MKKFLIILLLLCEFSLLVAQRYFITQGNSNDSTQTIELSPNFKNENENNKKSDWCNPNIIVSIVSTVIMLFTLIASIFSTKFELWLRRTKLKLNITNKFPDVTKTSIKDENNNIVPAFYFRLKIKNKGHHDAENVQVYLENIKDSNRKRLNNFLPMYLKWSYKSNEINKIETKIIRKSNRHCDLFYVPQGEDCLRFCVEENMDTNGICNDIIQKTGIYTITLLLAWSNSRKPKKYKVEINYIKPWTKSDGDKPQDFREFVEVRNFKEI